MSKTMFYSDELFLFFFFHIFAVNWITNTEGKVGQLIKLVKLFNCTLNPTSDFICILKSDHSLFNFAIFHNNQHWHRWYIKVISNFSQFIDIDLQNICKLFYWTWIKKIKTVNDRKYEWIWFGFHFDSLTLANYVFTHFGQINFSIRLLNYRFNAWHQYFTWIAPTIKCKKINS